MTIPMTAAEKKAWNTVADHMHYSGKHVDVLDDATKYKLRLHFGNGFGNLAGCDDANVADMVWDWSHVRDSSMNAIVRMADAIETCVLLGIGVAK
jgi:hypothetical protein